MKKNFPRQCFLMVLFGGALLLSGCGEDNNKSNNNNNNSISGKDYKLELPDGAGKVECKSVTDEQLAEIESNDYQFITQPIYVTKDGDDVFLDQMARVSFNIPEDYPKENYYRLMGVIITKDGPVYMIPDPEGIDQGVISFETSHFCPVGAVDLNDQTRRKEFIKRTAANGWQNDLCNADLEKTLKEKLMETAEDIGLGKNDFLGIAARKVLADNDLVKDAMSLIDGKEPAEMISEKLEAEVKARALGYLFGQLQKNPNNKKLKNYLETHLTVKNAEDWGTQLGEGKNPMRIAYEYSKGFAADKLKDFATTVCPYVKAVQKTALAMQIIKEFWSANEINEMYSKYSKKCRPDGTISDEEWGFIANEFRRLTAAKSNYGMSESEIRQMFANRYKSENDIRRKEYEIEKTVSLWENNYWLLQSKAFKNLDYVQRLTQIHKLMERFRKELVKNGDIPNRKASTSVDMLLCEIVEKYLEFHPDHEKFYAWLTKMGYNQNKFQAGMDQLDSERSWWLVRTDLFSKDNETGEHKKTYSVSPTSHTLSASWAGPGFHDDMYDVWYGPYDITVVATCEAPPAHMNPGDSIVLHASINMSGGETGWYLRAGSSLNFDAEGVGMGGIYYINRGTPINLNGSTEVGARYGEAKSGDWDYVMRVPTGRKDELRAINFDGCDCRTHWVYQWCTIFELEENNDENNTNNAEE